mgnify:CR=1 FL=1
MKVKELKEEERPREKAIQYGVNALSNRELIALSVSYTHLTLPTKLEV